MRVPIGVIAGILAFFLARQGGKPPDPPEILLFMLIGAVAGEYWATHELARQYRRRYKDQVLPQIASELGKLT